MDTTDFITILANAVGNSLYEYDMAESCWTQKKVQMK